MQAYIALNLNLIVKQQYTQHKYMYNIQTNTQLHRVMWQTRWCREIKYSGIWSDCTNTKHIIVMKQTLNMQLIYNSCMLGGRGGEGIKTESAAVR